MGGSTGPARSHSGYGRGPPGRLRTLLSAYHPGDYTPPKRQIAVDDVAGKWPGPCVASLRTG
jgi:hypothetical protein